MTDKKLNQAREIFYYKTGCMPEDKGLTYADESILNSVIFAVDLRIWQRVDRIQKESNAYKKLCNFVFYTGIIAVIGGFLFLRGNVAVLSNLIWWVAGTYFFLFIVLVLSFYPQNKWVDKHRNEYYIVFLGKDK